MKTTSKRATAASVSLIALAGAVVGAAVMATAEAQDNRTPALTGAVAPIAAPSFADLIEHVSPAVVSIEVRTQVSSPGLGGLNPDNLPPGYQEFFEFFQRGLPGQGQGQQGPREARGAGSGFFISPDGLMVTNHHVIADATSIRVTLKDGRELNAEVVGTDEPTDLALLRVEGDDFPFVQFDTDPRYRVGDWVVAVGNPFGLGGTATAGIISAIGREEIGARYNAFIQIDAPINRGNSGGPTFDLNGNVIGVNSQIYSPTGGNIGIGFAIPSDVAANVIEQLAETGSVTRGWLGVTIENVTQELAEALGADLTEGAIVAGVTPGSPAEDAGFQPGDIVTSVDGRTVRNATDLTRQVGSLRAGETTRFAVNRAGSDRTINVRIGVRPPESELLAAISPDEPRRGAQRESGETVQGMTLSSLNAATRSDLGLPEDVNGVAITNVASGSEAAQRGLQRGMVIGQVNGREVSSPRDVTRALDEARDSGRSAAALLVHVGGGSRFVTLPLDEEDAAAG